MCYICNKFLKNRSFGNLNMKRNLFFVPFTLFCFFAGFKAQRHEIGIQLGMANLVGDIGRTNYVLQPTQGTVSDTGLPIYAGVMYRMNVNPYQTFRLNLGFSNIQFDDRYAKENYRRMRKLWGNNSIYEADLLFEYSFFPINEEQKDPMLSPYIFGGFGGLYMSTSKPTLTIKSATNVDVAFTQDHGFTMAIPFGIGLKYKFNYNWTISGEFTFRPTFSDQVDYSSLEEKDIKVNTSINNAQTAIIVQNFLNSRNVGNPNSKDWVNSATLILSYSFGRPPCYCK